MVQKIKRLPRLTYHTMIGIRLFADLAKDTLDPFPGVRAVVGRCC